MNQIIDLMLNWFTCQPCLSTNNPTQSSNETIISHRTNFTSQHNSNPPSVITMQPSQTNQDSVGNAESKLDAWEHEKEVKSNLKRKSNKNTITTINKPKKRYKKDHPPPPIPQNKTANNFVNQSFVENESNADKKVEDNHENCEALAEPKIFLEISGLRNSNEDSKNEMQPNNYDSQNKSSVSTQSKKEENTTSTQSIEELLSQEDKVKLKIASIRQKAEPFEDLIKNFTESSESNQYYYIEENLKRLVDQLDEMYDDIKDNQILRMQRKEVYKVLFKLFDDLDAKVEENMLLFPK